MTVSRHSSASQHIRDLIGRGELRGAVTQIVAATRQLDPDTRNEATLHAAQLADIERRERSGILAQPDAAAARQRVGLAVLEMLDDVAARGTHLSMEDPPAPMVGTFVPPAVEQSAAADEGQDESARTAGGKLPTPAARNQVFVSYSHADREWLERLQQMLVPLVRNRAIDLWADTRLAAGRRWQTEIDDALQRARVAVLLVSPSFLASEFIQSKELPRLLAAAATDSVTILWVYLSECLYEETPIAQYQAAHNLTSPLDALALAEQNSALKRVCLAIKTAVA